VEGVEKHGPAEEVVSGYRPDSLGHTVMSAQLTSRRRDEKRGRSGQSSGRIDVRHHLWTFFESAQETMTA